MERHQKYVFETVRPPGRELFHLVTKIIKTKFQNKDAVGRTFLSHTRDEYGDMGGGNYVYEPNYSTISLK